MPKKVTTEDFIIKANIIHNNFYNYGLVNYVNNYTNIVVICPDHDRFVVIPKSHVGKRKQGCPICDKIKFSEKTKLSKTKLYSSTRLSREKDFIERANKIHNNKYDYSNINFIKMQSNIDIICPDHGKFSQIPINHLQGKGCIKCSKSYTTSSEEFILKAKDIHGDTYDYSKVIKETSYIPITIICKKHGEFEQLPSAHLLGRGCSYCLDHYPLDNDSFIYKANKIHNNKYDYSLVDYKRTDKKIIIICPDHGSFLQTGQIHLNGHGCPKCKFKVSKGEKEVVEYVKTIYDGIILENDRIAIKPKELDIYLPEINLAIEYNGEYWHNLKEEKDPGCHQLKEDLCKANGITLITIWEEEWFSNLKVLQEYVKKYIVKCLKK